MPGDTWEELGWVTVDRGVIAFGDASVLGSGLDPSELPSDDDADDPEGRAVVILWTRADVDLPVEVQRDESGLVSTARMCITDDVDDLAGVWSPVGSLTMPTGRCAAGDPCSTSSNARLEFPIATGAHVAEVFEFTDGGVPDRLALRIRR